MTKLIGIKYLKKGLEAINLIEDDFYDFPPLKKYGEKCTHLLWKIETLLWELEHLDGIPTEFNREAWREGRIDVRKVVELPDREAWREGRMDSNKKTVELPGLRRYIELMLETLREDADSLAEDLAQWKKCRGITHKKILTGYKKK